MLRLHNFASPLVFRDFFQTVHILVNMPRGRGRGGRSAQGRSLGDVLRSSKVHSRCLPAANGCRAAAAQGYRRRPRCRWAPMLEVLRLPPRRQEGKRRVNANATSPPHTSHPAAALRRQRRRCSHSIFPCLKQITFKARQCQSLRARSAPAQRVGRFVTTHGGN